MTYAIGPLSTSETLQPLQEALLAQGEIKAPSRVETQIARDGTEPAPFAVCSESLPLVRGRLAAEGFGEVPVPLLSSLGRIAAETVSDTTSSNTTSTSTSATLFLFPPLVVLLEHTE